MTRAAHLLSLLAAAWLVVWAIVWTIAKGAVGEAAVLLLAALVLVALAAVLGRGCGVCCETRRTRT
jgi:hypothetical protein